MKRLLVLGACMDQGGIARAFSLLADGLAKKGFDIKVVAPYKEDLSNIDIPSHYVGGYFWYCKIKNKWIGRIVRIVNWLTNWRFYFMFARKIPHDIFLNYAGNMCLQWVWYTNKPVVSWLHGKWAIRMESRLAFLFRKKIHQAIKKNACTIAVSCAAKEAWAQEFRIDDGICVIPNIVGVDDVIAKARSAQHEIRRKDGRPILLTVGRLSEEKGSLRLIKTYAKLKLEGFAFDAYFIGDGRFRSVCANAIIDGHLEGCVHLLGAKDNPYPHMEAADLLVVPSYHEGRSCVVTEALVLGVPVLSTDSGGPGELLQNISWGKVVENTDEGLYCGIKDFLLHGMKLPSPDEIVKLRQTYLESDKAIINEVEAKLNRFCEQDEYEK